MSTFFKTVKHMARRIWANECFSASTTIIGGAVFFYTLFFGSQVAVAFLFG
jgi:hypothetical protein